MKKILLLAAIIASTSAYAQVSGTDTSGLSSLKPVQKNWSTELNINPIKGDLSLNNAINQIKFRKFTSPDFAFRLAFNADRIGSVVEDNNPYGENPMNYKDDKSSTTLGLNFGFEKHFKGTRRLSPYMGLEIAFADKSSKQKITSGPSTLDIKGGWSTTVYSNVYVPNYNNGGYQYISQPTQQITEVAYFSYGLNAVSGFDYYISKHFFFGYEVNFGFSQVNYKDLEFNQSGTTSVNNNNGDQKNRAFNFGANLSNGIRLGYVL